MNKPINILNKTIDIILPAYWNMAKSPYFISNSLFIYGACFNSENNAILSIKDIINSPISSGINRFSNGVMCSFFGSFAISLFIPKEYQPYFQYL